MSMLLVAGDRCGGDSTSVFQRLSDGRQSGSL